MTVRWIAPAPSVKTAARTIVQPGHSSREWTTGGHVIVLRMLMPSGLSPPGAALQTSFITSPPLNYLPDRLLIDLHGRPGSFQPLDLRALRAGANAEEEDVGDGFGGSPGGREARLGAGQAGEVAEDAHEHVHEEARVEFAAQLPALDALPHEVVQCLQVAVVRLVDRPPLHGREAVVHVAHHRVPVD